MTEIEIHVDDDEHDMARDEVLERVAEIDDDATRVSILHGYMSGAVIGLVPYVTHESLIGLLEHLKDCAKDYATAIDGAPQ